MDFRMKNLKRKNMKLYWRISFSSIVLLLFFTTCGTIYKYFDKDDVEVSNIPNKYGEIEMPFYNQDSMPYYYYVKSHPKLTRDSIKAFQNVLYCISPYKGLKLNGTLYRFYLNGDTMSIESFKKGKWDGTNVFFYFYGNKRELCNSWKNGKQHGVEYQYDKTGLIRFVCHWDMNKREGEELGYYKNGSIRYKGNYRNNCKDGVWYHFTESGDTLKIEYWDKGKAVDSIMIFPEL